MTLNISDAPLPLQIVSISLLVGFIIGFVIAFSVLATLIIKSIFLTDYPRANFAERAKHSNEFMNDLMLSPKMKRTRLFLFGSFSMCLLCLLSLFLLTVLFGTQNTN